MTTRTTNFKLILPDFNSKFWHDEEYANLRSIDTILAQYVALGNVYGVWTNSTAYTTGQVLIDDALGLMFECAADHTSAATGTFEADRLARPALWVSATVTNRYRGAWESGAEYRPGDFVVSGNKYAVATQLFTSGATFADDEADELFDVLIDLSAIPASAVPVPNVSTALYFVRQNSAGDGYEVRSPAQVASDISAGTVISVAAGNGMNFGTITSSGTVAAHNASTTQVGVVELATAAETKAATSATLVAALDMLNHHPGVAKFWAKVAWSGGVPSLAASHNVASITDHGIGDFTLTFTTAFASTHYAVSISYEDDSGGTAVNHPYVANGGQADGSVRINIRDNGGSLVDNVPSIYVVGFGHQV